MKAAHHRNAVLEQKFHFRKQIFPQSRPGSPSGSPQVSHANLPSGAAITGVDRSDEYELMTINEIINGDPEKGFPGLLGLVNNYLNTLNIDIETRCEISKYLELVKKRANGSLMTAASWMRDFVQSHPDYKHDSVVSEKINYDLVKMVEKINKGEVQEPKLLGHFTV